MTIHIQELLALELFFSVLWVSTLFVLGLGPKVKSSGDIQGLLPNSVLRDNSW